MTRQVILYQYLQLTFLSFVHAHVCLLTNLLEITVFLSGRVSSFCILIARVLRQTLAVSRIDATPPWSPARQQLAERVSPRDSSSGANCSPLPKTAIRHCIIAITRPPGQAV